MNLRILIDLCRFAVCQAYYNPHIINVVNKLVAGVDRQQMSAILMKHSKEAGNYI